MIDPGKLQNDFSVYVGRGREGAAALEERRAELRRELDGRLFERPAGEWYRRACVEAFLFMYDTRFYDRAARHYRIDEILDDGEREFGGYDFVLLWQSYPRLAIDGRNQFDMYRDMPGGLPALRELVERAHAREVRVFVNYNPWDTGTRREAEGASDGEALAGIIAEIGADGVFLDTMAMDQPGFREALERANPDVVFDPEGVPPLGALHSVAGSWLQRRLVAPPALMTMRWLEPRFSFRAIVRTALDRQEVVQAAFFHGCGHVVWENIFGWWNPWSAPDRALLRRCTWLLREHAAAFQDQAWQPYVATLAEGVYAHRWQDGATVVHTLLNTGADTSDGPVLEVAAGDAPGAPLRHYDVLERTRVGAGRARRRGGGLGPAAAWRGRLRCVGSGRGRGTLSSRRCGRGARRGLSRARYRRRSSAASGGAVGPGYGRIRAGRHVPAGGRCVHHARAPQRGRGDGRCVLRPTRTIITTPTIRRSCSTCAPTGSTVPRSPTPSSADSWRLPATCRTSCTISCSTGSAVRPPTRSRGAGGFRPARSAIQ